MKILRIASLGSDFIGSYKKNEGRVLCIPCTVNTSKK